MLSAAADTYPVAGLFFVEGRSGYFERLNSEGGLAAEDRRTVGRHILQLGMGAVLDDDLVRYLGKALQSAVPVDAKMEAGVLLLDGVLVNGVGSCACRLPQMHMVVELLVVAGLWC